MRGSEGCTTAIDFEVTDFQGFMALDQRHMVFYWGGSSRPMIQEFYPVYDFFLYVFVISCFSGDEDEDSKLCASLCSKEEVAEVSNCTSLSVEFLGIKSGSVISQYDKEKRKLIDLKVPIGRGHVTVPRIFFLQIGLP